MAIAVGVIFCRTGRVYWYDPAGLEIQKGDKVVAETELGESLGVVKAAPHERPDERLTLPLKPLLRKADIDDLRRANENKFREQQAFRTGLEKIAQHDLPMKLIATELTFDRSKMIFHFVADNRVDFRELAKDLARTIHCRVELHQIGVRDEAKLLGGLGPCGKELCCCSFLTQFDPVGIKMAKAQDLSLNPQKISGVCGRLMCCLAFEYCCYRDAKKDLPNLGSKIMTSRGVGRITDINIVRGDVTVQLEEGGTLRLTTQEAAAAEVLDSRPDEKSPEEESLDETALEELDENNR